jgi:hypothetical protein
MDGFEALKQKYASVLQLIERGGARLDHLQLQDAKLYMQGGIQDPRNNSARAVIGIDDPKLRSESCTFDIQWSSASGGSPTGGFPIGRYCPSTSERLTGTLDFGCSMGLRTARVNNVELNRRQQARAEVRGSSTRSRAC